eukprot:CAMPEP_0183389834 /NCGR_PEP_ID=MMETSP0370-20130417/5188_1 /TAXON_ID=268820 /ORGANISM="Peridinium aciculiferum, Strain PAER-2" /LENGTH=30 /DNA_ID= /DNA_START= /DNA_END= /DNA_ORIENTATION=
MNKIKLVGRAEPARPHARMHAGTRNKSKCA